LADPRNPRRSVSVIVPTRDGHDILRNCIESILEKTRYRSFEILIIDNQSNCAQTLAYMKQLGVEHPGRIRVLRYDRPFNYSAINNFAARHARGEVLGLINNDVEVISPTGSARWSAMRCARRSAASARCCTTRTTRSSMPAW
jgi:glycosyltransferase involved in cell wall biosynthesis